MVSNLITIHENLWIRELHLDAQQFRGGNIKNHKEKWYKYTKDSYILDIVSKGLELELTEIPFQNVYNNHSLSNDEKDVLSQEISKLRAKKVIIPSRPEAGQFISSVFPRDKKNGNKRMILNLKKFNKFVDYKHFKMESITHVLNLIQPNVYMASIDLKDAFFSVPIFEDHQKYLKFYFQLLYQLTVCLMVMDRP